MSRVLWSEQFFPFAKFIDVDTVEQPIFDFVEMGVAVVSVIMDRMNHDGDWLVVVQVILFWNGVADDVSLSIEIAVHLKVRDAMVITVVSDEDVVVIVSVEIETLSVEVDVSLPGTGFGERSNQCVKQLFLQLLIRS